MNRKGFMMAELVVVSSIVLVTMVAMYASYNKVYSAYKSRITYYDVTTLYRLGYYRDVLVENDILNTSIDASTSDVLEIYNSSSDSGKIMDLPDEDKEQFENFQDVVYLINNNKQSINRDVLNGKNAHVTFLEYLDYLETSIDFSKVDYMMVMERCSYEIDGANNLVVDEDSCYYAYLEVYKEVNEGY